MENRSTGSNCSEEVVHGFFRNVLGTVKSAFIHHRDPQPSLEDKFVQTLDEDPGISVFVQTLDEDLGISVFVQTLDEVPVIPKLMCFPSQVCEDPKSLSGFSRTEQDSSDAELSSVSLPSTSDLDDRSQKRADSPFFWRLSEAAKSPFLGYKPDKQDLPSSMPVEPEVPLCLPVGLQFGTTLSFFFHVGEDLGSGAYSQVYEGTHIFDKRFKVAIKHRVKRAEDRYLDTANHSKPVLAEVALMLRLKHILSCTNIIDLHHWFEDETSVFLFMEKPDPCQTLQHYISHTDNINEAKARWMIRQLVQAVKHCVHHGVFHGDLHSGNILVVTDDRLTLKLIGFGCGRLISSEGFESREYQGAELVTPPEVLRGSVFYAEPAYVWAVGVVLFEILHKHLPFETLNDILDGEIKMSLNVSEEFEDLIFQCLMRDPAKRLTLTELEKHSWFKKKNQIRKCNTEK